MSLNPRKPFCKLNIEPGAKGFLGCSAWASAMGMSEFKDSTPRSAYHRFIGDAPAPTEELQAIYDRGHRWEEYVAKEIMSQFGYKLKRVNSAYVHPVKHSLVCHPDRLQIGLIDGKRIGVEIKTSSVFMNKKWGDENTDEVPMDYYIQCLGYMACGVCDEVHLFRCSDFKLMRYIIKYDEEKIAKMEAMLFPVIDSFENGVEPNPSNWKEITSTFTDPKDDLVADESIEALCDEYDKARDEEKEAKKHKESVRDVIVSKMAGKRRIVTKTGRPLHTYSMSMTTSFDMDSFKADNPELYSKYSSKSERYSFR